MSAEEIAERVAVWIEAGRFRPGDHLKELDIAKKCNSSRAPVREAMRILQFQGFISLTRHLGARVIDPLDASVTEIGLLRRAYAGIIGRAAAEAADIPEEKQALLAHALSMREVVEHDHWEPMAELVQQGVEMLFELSPAKLTVGFARRMRNGSTPYRDRAVGTRELRQEVADIWQSAAEAIVAAKGDEAEQALFRAVDQFVRSANEGDGAERPAPTGRTA